MPPTIKLDQAVGFNLWALKAVVLDAVTYRSGVANAAREGEMEICVRRLSSAEVLYWDDFEQTHLSGAASEMLLHLVE
jgi:hypothetical protein